MRMKLSSGKELVATELALLRDLGVDRRQSSWLAFRKVKPVLIQKASVTPLPKCTAVDRKASQ